MRLGDDDESYEIAGRAMRPGRGWVVDRILDNGDVRYERLLDCAWVLIDGDLMEMGADVLIDVARNEMDYVDRTEPL